jgi:hypothetical protein
VTKTYTRAEADEILRRALSEQAPDGINHDDLLAAAREVGIAESAIEKAAEQLGEHRVVTERVALIRARKRRAFARQLFVFLVVNAGIFAFDWFDGGPWFFQFVLIPWAIIMTLMGLLQLAPDQEKLMRRAERELERERRRMARQQRPRVERGASPNAAREFEAAVQEGVSALLSGAARHIRTLASDRPRVRVDEEPHMEGATPPSDSARSRRTRTR